MSFAEHCDVKNRYQFLVTAVMNTLFKYFVCKFKENYGIQNTIFTSTEYDSSISYANLLLIQSSVETDKTEIY